MASSSDIPTGDERPRELITYYFTRRYEYDANVHFLATFHQMTFSIGTLTNRLRQHGLRSRTPTYDFLLVRDAILRELNGRFWLQWRLQEHVAYVALADYSSTKAQKKLKRASKGTSNLNEMRLREVKWY